MRAELSKNRIAAGMLAVLLSVCMVFTMMPSIAFAAGDAQDNYADKTVILYSGNLRGDVDQYAKLAAAKRQIAETADAVYLVDAGNYLQGTTYANTTRGAAIYDLMDAAGYDVAAMGAYEFAYGDATTGQKYHQNLTKFYTQKMLYLGQDEVEYNRNMPGTSKATLAAKEPADFNVISSNITGTSSARLDNAEVTVGQGEKLFAFEQNCIRNKGSLKIGFAAQTDSFGLDTLQDGLGEGLQMAETTTLPEDVDLVIGLSNDGEPVEGANATIYAPTGGDTVIGMLVISNNVPHEISEPVLELSAEAEDVKAAVDTVKSSAAEVIAESDVTLVGKNTKHRYEESEMGDLVTDALLWYANNKFEGFKKDVPVVAIQNGGNIRKTIHTGDIIYDDIFNGYPYSPKGVGILYVTGEQLLESLEEANYDNPSNAFPHVAGMTYNLDLNEEYDASTTKGENGNGAYGNYFYADSYNRVSITSIAGKAFDPKATYAVVGDNMVVANGLDTYATFKDAVAAGAKYIDNGTGILVRDVVSKYLKEACGGQMPEKYAEPQNRITFGDSTYKQVKAAMETAKASGDAAAYLAAAKEMKKEAEITNNPDKITEAQSALTEAIEPFNTAFAAATVSKIGAKTYTGKAQKPTVTVKSGSTVLKAGTDYKLSYKNNVNAGKATVIITGIGNYSEAKAKTTTFTINKAANTLKVKAVKKTFTAKKKKATSFAAKKVFKVTKNVSKGKVTYKKTKGNKKITISKAGKVTVKKGLKKGKTYTVKVKATSAATKNYKAKSAIITLKFKIK